MNNMNTILVVDDNIVNRKLLTKILSEKYKVVVANNGLEALNIMNQNTEINAILLDLIMPVMDGFGFLEEFNKNVKFSYIPVFIVTAAKSLGNEEKALKMGAMDFIAKPYNPNLIFAKISNVLKLIKAQKEIEILGRDTVTGLLNIAAFNYYANELLNKTKEIYYLVKLNISDFKLINSELGHEQGNNMLHCIGEAIEKITYKDTLSARAFGDRFLILTRNIDNIELKVTKIIEKIDDEFNARLSFRVGIVVIEKYENDINYYVDQSSLACTSADRNNQININYYDKNIIESAIYKKTLLDSFEESIKNKNFEVYYQPKFNLKNLEIIGAEALVRWNHRTLGFIAPGMFIATLEENNIIDKLDFYVLETTCEFIRNRINNNLKIIPISVNVSRYDLNKDLVYKYNDLLKYYNLSKDMIHLEITESYASMGTEKIIDVTNELRKHNYIIELDDFGSGYSSLNVLSEMQIDIIKLDLRFIRSESVNRKMITYVVSLAKSMDYMLIIEGVETKEELDLLVSLGCEYGQGYYYSRPLKKEDFIKFLKERL
jgi:diguanylate cyclase (GGDEF)-like protein